MERRSFIKTLFAVPAAAVLPIQNVSADQLVIDDPVKSGIHNYLVVFADGRKEIFQRRFVSGVGHSVPTIVLYKSVFVKDLDTGEILKQRDREYDTSGAVFVDQPSYFKPVKVRKIES